MAEGTLAGCLDVRVSVFVVGEVRLVREGFAQALAAGPGIDVLGTAAVAGAVALLGRVRPNVVLADPASSRSPELIAAAAAVGARIVAAGVAEQDEVEVLACATAGVAGFVGGDAALDDLRTALGVAARGEVQCSARVAAVVFRRLSDLAKSLARNERSTLTRREREIADLIGQGLSNKEIGVRLCIAPATVKNHVHNLLEKLGVHRRALVATLVRFRHTAANPPDSGLPSGSRSSGLNLVRPGPSPVLDLDP